ncbi:lipolytic enzyme, G-D-S-L [Celeribacter ethanolicus]|uniref:Lipolytic enzyme, G-D-S-L n=1 Tax=Celeribacter ethanolicus TaxID=1758178 RepID=A0A291GHA0_9RHOB|nr:GDSL-type esterase/lipase family protein [Celeribacter ethanolicus]ATG49749.1 lipolytic enzyme, G-D-S-L [Celeribacter ethanolicus]TNE65473.1 MAG: lipolytic enzyme, G-D-S-L [Paracoccaceae bacterium]
MPSILTFGDSNTHGTQPMRSRPSDLPRLARRWPVAMAETLGWDLVEEGLPGRTFAFPDPEMGPHMDGRLGLFIALESHGPIDAMTIMLGTNDLKAHFEADPEDIAAACGFHLDVALSEEMQARHGGFEPILILPPRPHGAGCLAETYAGAAEKAEAVQAAMRAEAEARDVAVFDANEVISVSALDGVHFDAAAHEVLGRAVAAFILSEIED